MKKMLSLLSFIFLTTSSAWATTYPLTIENCGQKETFTKAPARVVALGQNTAEIMLLLGLQDKMVASAFWPTKVLPELAEKNAKVPVLTVEIPTLESILAKNPDFVAAQIQLLMGPSSKVAKREDFESVGINTYLSPGMCATKQNTGDIYGSRSTLWNMAYVYEEIADFAKIFNVEDRGQQVINDFKKRESALRKAFPKGKKDLSFVFWFSSSSPTADAYVGGKNGASGFIADLLGGHNAITTETEWPTVSWESIIAANPDVIVVTSLDRNRWKLDSAEEKIKFLKSDPAVSQLDAVKKGHIVVMDGQAMNPTIRTIYGAEQVAEQLRKMGLN
ncbi:MULTISPECIES: ABC transporter substrate-binding protein [Pantoea]|uniref:ABC transporter substrate-binding protein n=1 Tax=Pantoea stewartii subsp. stewartii DC283 TaxID=660596 RepID=H3RG62_PANSE|nr:MULTISPECIES: ABC transporter substrate-binding protein [Pantoea]KKW51542.1 ABC transporter substrate-binding protein [Pantoea ananatis]ARF49117.1 ABC transporter substrate-binding protein [Pantoea stewartii subsp. stewartii DC283]EHT99677.1 putative ABC transporter periplasmic solute-binding protein [Pantoea stewartii subsp. stewartii DC283]KAB0551737.1 ABC transporter substrate-binding protein [Pantoea stewartii subsp. stewartii]KGD83952.1 ABC transporter substrate-binding protein [Pantoe